MKIRNFAFYGSLQKKLEKECKRKYGNEGPLKFIEIIGVIEEIQNMQIPRDNKWKQIQKNVYEIMPFGHKPPERLFCYKKAGSEEYVIVEFDLRKKHEKIKSEYLKLILKKGKNYFGG